MVGAFGWSVKMKNKPPAIENRPEPLIAELLPLGKRPRAVRTSSGFVVHLERLPDFWPSTNASGSNAPGGSRCLMLKLCDHAVIPAIGRNQVSGCIAAAPVMTIE